MYMLRRSWILVALASFVLAAAVLPAGCGSDDSSQFGEAPDTGAPESGPTPPPIFPVNDDGDASDGGCATGKSCGDGGVCAGNVCCEAKLACGDVCCGGMQVCSFQKCVVPGAICHDSSDC